MTGAATGGTGPSPAGWASWLAWIVAFALLSGLIQLLIPCFFDGDTGYHLAVARLTREHGVLHAFPWTPFSWLAEHYADKELLFHWLLVPLASLDPIWASRVAGTVLGTALLVTIYTLLRAERVADAGLWTLVPLAVSSAFVVRFAMVRPHLLSVPLTLVLAWAAVRQRRVLLALAGFLFPLCYTAWHLPLVPIGLVEGTRWLSKEQRDWCTPAVLLPALALGILVHPNFPESAQLFWIQNVGILFGTAWSGTAGVDLGGEFKPFPPPIAQLLRDIIREGAQVVTCGWRLTGEMMLALPERRFMVALDPVLFAVGDPERYRVWFETVHSPPPRPAVLLRDTFKASYVLCAEQERWRSLHTALAEDPAAALRGDIGPWRVYQLRPPEFDAAALSRR